MNISGTDKREGAISAIAVLLLFALFALLSVGVLTAGMMVYKRTSNQSDRTYVHRVSLSYLANQVRQADMEDSISVRSFHGVDAIVFKQTIDDSNYYTYLYVWDGLLRELFFEEGLELPPESGSVIVELTEMKASANDNGLLSLSLDYGDGEARGQLTLALRTGVALP